MCGGDAGSSDGGGHTEHVPSTEADAFRHSSGPECVKKDMRSFPQRLFDTAAFKSFQTMSAMTVTTENDGVPGDQDYNCLLGGLNISNLSPQYSPTKVNQARNALAVRSIIQILGNVDDLLSSFRTPPYSFNGVYEMSINFIEYPSNPRTLAATSSFTTIWEAFSKLMRGNRFKSTMTLCLRSSLRKVERSRFVFGRSSLRESSNEDSQPFPDTLGASDIVHIVNIVLAALVASVPICSPEDWAKIRSFRSAGLVLPASEYSQDNVLHRRLLDVMESLEGTYFWSPCCPFCTVLRTAIHSSSLSHEKHVL